MEHNMKVGVVGAGTMGQGIAQIAATAGHGVVLVDRDQAALDRAVANLTRILNRLVEKGRLAAGEPDRILSRIETASEVQSCASCGLAIEAVIEKEEVKQGVFSALEAVVAPDSVLASNTSSLSITRLAAGLKHPDRMIGLHFFNPAPLLPLVEVVPALQTRDGLSDQMVALMRNWGKQPAVAKDTPGFIVNRVARPFYGEAIRLYEERVADIPTIDWAMTELGGFRMGPFQLMDLIGNDINYAVTESVWRAFHHDPRYTPSFAQKRNVDAGWLGRKSGRGWHDHAGGRSPAQNGQGPRPGHPVADSRDAHQRSRRRRLLGRRESGRCGPRHEGGRQLPERPVGMGRRSGVGPLRRHAGPAQGPVWRGTVSLQSPSAPTGCRAARLLQLTAGINTVSRTRRAWRGCRRP